MTVRLRAHHLLCLLTYEGRGYSLAFTANCDAVAHRIGLGESILITAGPDDICAPLLDEPDAHCLGDSVTERDRRAARGLATLLGRPIMPGLRIELGEVQLLRMREGFSTGEIRAACGGCEWHDRCSEIAWAGYPGVRLR